MDQQDLQLITMLMHNRRATHRELADRMGMSVQAVHRRLQIMQGSKVFLSFTTTLANPNHGAIPVSVDNRAPGKIKKEVIAAFEKDTPSSGVLFGSDGVLVSALLYLQRDGGRDRRLITSSALSISTLVIFWNEWMIMGLALSAAMILLTLCSQRAAEAGA